MKFLYLITSISICFLVIGLWIGLAGFRLYDQNRYVLLNKDLVGDLMSGVHSPSDFYFIDVTDAISNIIDSNEHEHRFLFYDNLRGYNYSIVLKPDHASFTVNDEASGFTREKIKEILLQVSDTGYFETSIEGEYLVSVLKNGRLPSDLSPIHGGGLISKSVYQINGEFAHFYTAMETCDLSPFRIWDKYVQRAREVSALLFEYSEENSQRSRSTYP